MKKIALSMGIILFLCSCSMAIDTSSGSSMGESSDTSTGAVMEQEPAEVITLTPEQEEALIRQYYSDIALGKLQDAYALRGTSAVTYDTFSSWYREVESMKLDDIESFDESRYSYTVRLREGGKDTEYLVTTEVNNGKLYTLHSIETTPMIEDEETSSPSEDPKQMIRDYYNLISAGKITAAYNMQAVSRVSPNTYREWYANTAYALLSEIKEEDGAYLYSVFIINKDKSREEYDVKMKIVDGKLDAVYSNKLPDTNQQVVKGSGVEAYVDRNTDEGTSVSLFVKTAGGEPQLVDKIMYTDSPYFEGFNPEYFSMDGAYFVYEISGVEFHQTKVWDVVNSTLVHSSEIPPFLHGFTNGHEYFYECTSDGFFPGFFKVYQVPGFEMVGQYNEEMGIHKCMDYNPTNNKIGLSVGAAEDSLQEWIYDFGTRMGVHRDGKSL